MIRTVLLACAVVSLATNAYSWSDLESSETALNLANVLASEEICGLSYDQSAIADWIARTVPADDFGFTTSLNAFVSGKEYELKSISKSQKTAHCAQTSRVAKSFGFID